MTSAAIRAYLGEIGKIKATGQASEHSYRRVLQNLIESMDAGVKTLNEPRWVKCGAPDMRVSRNEDPLGHIETKKPGINLEQTRASEQIRRYLGGLPNFILTDYEKFIWFRDGEEQERADISQNQANVAALLRKFLAQDPPSCGTAEALVERLAGQAQLLCDAIEKAAKGEGAGGRLRAQISEMQELLLPKLTIKEFADLMAQTITYGLFMARYYHKEAEGAFSYRTASFDIPPASSFLRDIFSQLTGPNMNPNLQWAVENISILLARLDMGAIFTGFGEKGMRRDAILHFYENFLQVYDPKTRERRGVYYTPEPVVSYIVRSVDKILQEKFGLAEGLADKSQLADGSSHRVLILDPAAGSGTFLWAVIQQIQQNVNASGGGGAWPDYARRHLLPRLFGFELQMAPYVVCHLKLGVKLKEEGFDLESDDRLGVYLTNTLEPPPPQKMFQGHGFGYEIALEGEHVSEIKMKKPVMVVLGNPPYSGESANKGEWITRLMHGVDNHESTANYFKLGGKPLGEKNVKWVNDDYVKFIRLAHRRIEKTGEGVLAYITNHAWLDNPTFRGMRESLIEDFDEIYIFDLHGSTKKKEQSPDGSKDENVFDIQQGVAISLFIRKSGDRKHKAKVFHADLWGERGKIGSGGGKYGWLAEHDIGSTKWKALHPKAPFYFFVPVDDTSGDEYRAGWSIKDIMPVNSVGLVTARDKLAVQYTEEDIRKIVKDFSALPAEEARAKYNLPADVEDWKVSLAQKDLREHPNEHLKPICYRPFDTRFTYYTGRSRGFICRPRPKVMRHMLEVDDNLGLITVRQQSQQDTVWSHVSMTRQIIESCAISNKTKEINYLFPLYFFPKGQSNREPNLNKGLITEIIRRTKLAFCKEGPGDLKKDFGPEDVLHYIYAVLHSPAYRERYKEFLKSDFPRIPLPGGREVFCALAGVGGALRGLHLMDANYDSADMPVFPKTGSMKIEKLAYVPPTQENPKPRVWINGTQYFEGVSPEVWEFAIGGYQPAQHWLKERKKAGRKLTSDDVEHYRRICVSLAATGRLMDKIDRLIEQHGGWPGAFTEKKGGGKGQG